MVLAQTTRGLSAQYVSFSLGKLDVPSRTHVFSVDGSRISTSVVGWLAVSTPECFGGCLPRPGKPAAARPA